MLVHHQPLTQSRLEPLTGSLVSLVLESPLFPELSRLKLTLSLETTERFSSSMEMSLDKDSTRTLASLLKTVPRTLDVSLKSQSSSLLLDRSALLLSSPHTPRTVILQDKSTPMLDLNSMSATLVLLLKFVRLVMSRDYTRRLVMVSSRTSPVSQILMRSQPPQSSMSTLVSSLLLNPKLLSSSI